MTIQYDNPMIPFDEEKLAKGWTKEAPKDYEGSNLTFFREHEWYSNRELDVSLGAEKANEDGGWIMRWSNAPEPIASTLALQVLELFGFRGWIAERFPSGMIAFWASSHAPSEFGCEIAENAFNTFPPDHAKEER